MGRILKITKKRIFFFVVFILMFIITEVGRKIYRPYIYENDIFDFWIADTIGNFTGTMAIIFFDFAIINPAYKAGRIVLIFITFGLIVYEFAQYFSPRSVLDWRDIVATMIAGLISLGIYERLCHLFAHENTPTQKAT